MRVALLLPIFLAFAYCRVLPTTIGTKNESAESNENSVPSTKHDSSEEIPVVVKREVVSDYATGGFEDESENVPIVEGDEDNHGPVFKRETGKDSDESNEESSEEKKEVAATRETEESSSDIIQNTAVKRNTEQETYEKEDGKTVEDGDDKLDDDVSRNPVKRETEEEDASENSADDSVDVQSTEEGEQKTVVKRDEGSLENESAENVVDEQVQTENDDFSESTI